MAEEIERLNYFQRQYLGAEDFKAEQQYHRDMRRRHNLGQHTWSIVVGLELIEKAVAGSTTGAVDVFIQPGMAVDGFGREIILEQPAQLSPADFASFHSPLPQFREVWIAYREETALATAAGYEQCDIENQFTRVLETFRVVVQPAEPTHDAVTVDGKEVFPPPPPPTPSPDLTIPPDESVPYQELPEDGTQARWLVRLGSVNWDGANQQFVAADAGDPANSFKLITAGRAYAGSVTAEILAPSRTLTIRDRATASLPALGADQGADTSQGATVEVEGSLQVDRLLTAKADVQIHGRKLDFRDLSGDGGGSAFTMLRKEAGGAGGIDLQINVGNDEQGKNRLAVRSKDTDRVTIADNGTTRVDGDLTVLNQKNLTIDGGRLNIQSKGHTPAEWAVKTDGENLQFIKPDDGDRVLFELLDAGSNQDNAIFRLHGTANATLSADQLIDLTDGGITTLHTHRGATTTTRGMVEIADHNEAGTTGDSGVRLVIPADDPRLLTQSQKDQLTGGGLTSLHRHPNGILNNVRGVDLFADNSTDIADIDLFSTKRVVALIHIRAMDPRASFDRGDGFFADIFSIDGAKTFTSSWDGDHLGPLGSDSNLLVGFYFGPARVIRFRLRSTEDASVWANGIVFFEDL